MKKATTDFDNAANRLDHALLVSLLYENLVSLLTSSPTIQKPEGVSRINPVFYHAVY